MNTILFNNNEQQRDNSNTPDKNKQAKPNLFQGRTETETQAASFPNWDIVPPNQFINPRIKPQ
ncbi:hypothetical protein SAMN05421788_105110 [Filimonas lacunae]|uniref:Uncharacterized protein n=1 Tax=Filimonas lacunae TaxID=477680 RepID=A0A173MD45_9BACT|nr:hypothetical protein [Filimonas lacunae]BAV05436.1 hypothetical protein FLA_1443 [Filimonas lacunae]SIT21146.1 hypothetical protein SAMN05421788_105110 [Filimonas lacunae]